MKQQTLFNRNTKKRYARTSHGGSPSKGKRKLERPLSTKHWLHLVLKSQKAKGPLSFLHYKNKVRVENILRTKARKFGVKIADMANVGNHFHLKIRVVSRASFQKFLKSVTALIARTITGARRGKPFGKFWDSLAFTRVLKTYKEELNLRGYLAANRAEAYGGAKARNRILEAFNTWVYRNRRTSSA